MAEKAPECAEVGPEAASQEESGAKEEGSPAEAMPRPPLGRGASKPVTKLKKVISRKKSRQTGTDYCCDIAKGRGGNGGRRGKA